MTKDFIQLEHSDEHIINFHDPSLCAGRPCTIHNRTDHAMRSFPQHWRNDRGIMERINPFGGACPDPDSPWPVGSAEWVHGCIINPAYPSVGLCSPWEIDGVEAAWIDKRYAVTKDGRVWSFIRGQGPKRGNRTKIEYDKPPRALAARDNGRGYETVNLTTSEGKRTDYYIHRLVLVAWRGECPEGMESRHLNGDRSDNRLDNLQWGTSQENHIDKVRHGTVMQGSAHANSKLSENNVRAARELWSTGMTLPQITAELSLQASKGAIHDAIIGRTWKHVEGPANKKRQQNGFTGATGADMNRHAGYLEGVQDGVALERRFTLEIINIERINARKMLEASRDESELHEEYWITYEEILEELEELIKNGKRNTEL